MTTYQFDYQARTSRGYKLAVSIGATERYGSWECPNGSEGGSLWFEGNMLVDFDGAHELSSDILQQLVADGFTIDTGFLPDTAV